MTKTKTLIAKVVIKSNNPDKLPDFGLGKGVLSIQEIQFKSLAGQKFDSPSFAHTLFETGSKLISDVVEVSWEEKKPKRKKA